MFNLNVNNESLAAIQPLLRYAFKKGIGVKVGEVDTGWADVVNREVHLTGKEEGNILLYTLAHELGHMQASYKRQDATDELLAWDYAHELMEQLYGEVPSVEEYRKFRAECLETYGIIEDELMVWMYTTDHSCPFSRSILNGVSDLVAEYGGSIRYEPTPTGTRVVVYLICEELLEALVSLVRDTERRAKLFAKK